MASNANNKTNVSKYQVKGYVPTSVPTGVYGSNSISNGVVRATGNLTDRGYPSSNGTTSNTTSGYTLRSTSSAKPSSSTSKASSAATNASSDYYDDGSDAYYGALLAAYQKKQNDYDEYLRQQREAAQNAYDRSMNALNSAYDTQMNTLSSNLGETKNQLLDAYNRSKSSVNQDAEASMRQAYINHMLSQKNLNQQLSAQGITGGATETTLANLANSYGNARNNINTTLNNNLSNLEGNYNSGLSQAMQAYNSAVANANMQKAQQRMALEDALSNNQMSALSDYQSLLQRDNDSYLDFLKTALSNSMKYAYNPTKATNAVKAASMNQSINPTLTTNYQALKNLMDIYSNGGNGTNVSLANVDNNNNNYLAAILSQLY